MTWQPTACIENLQVRSQTLANIRSFFADRSYLEVETPIMGSCGVTDVYLESITAQFQSTDYFLQTSPEYHMKRLLAAGSGSIYQIFKAFRNDEIGRMHNPEFTLLEWYKLGADYHALIEEVDEFLQQVLACKPALKFTYKEVFQNSCDLNPFATSIKELQFCLQKYGLDNVLSIDESDFDQYLFLLMSHVVEPYLADFAEPVFVYDFPTSQAALAKVKNGIAERFEVYFKGVELANGFAELTDADLQDARFQKDNATRRLRGLSTREIDKRFIQALKYGLPECSGVALGVDRLLALLLNESDIARVVAFTIDNA